MLLRLTNEDMLHCSDLVTATTDGDMNLAICIHIALLKFCDAEEDFLLQSSLPFDQNAEALNMLFRDLGSMRHQPTNFRKRILCTLRYLPLTWLGSQT